MKYALSFCLALGTAIAGCGAHEPPATRSTTTTTTTTTEAPAAAAVVPGEAQTGTVRWNDATPTSPPAASAETSVTLQSGDGTRRSVEKRQTTDEFGGTSTYERRTTVTPVR